MRACAAACIFPASDQRLTRSVGHAGGRSSPVHCTTPRGFALGARDRHGRRQHRCDDLSLRRVLLGAVYPRRLLSPGSPGAALASSGALWAECRPTGALPDPARPRRRRPTSSFRGTARTCRHVSGYPVATRDVGRVPLMPLTERGVLLTSRAESRRRGVGAPSYEVVRTPRAGPPRPTRRSARITTALPLLTSVMIMRTEASRNRELRLRACERARQTA